MRAFIGSGSRVEGLGLEAYVVILKFLNMMANLGESPKWERRSRL